MTVRAHDGTPFDISVSVAIVGGGACGLTAALAARDAGRDVMLFERDSAPGGSTAMSSGMIPACGTRLQHEAGVGDDTPERMAADIQARARGEADPGLLDLMCRTSGPAIDWLTERHGLDLELVAGPPYPGHGRQRTHAPPSHDGEDLVAGLVAAARRAGVDIVCDARVTGLIMDSGDGRRIAGFVVERPDGKTERVGCAALILASSGFGANPDLVRRYIPDIADGAYFGHEGNKGEAILWGVELGAELRHMGAWQGHGAIAVPHGALVSWALMSGGGILINRDGHRFADEARGSSNLAPEVVVQPGGFAWAVFDARLHDTAMRFPDYRQLDELVAVKKGGDSEKLAASCGLPADSLAEALAGTGLHQPYCAIRVTGGLLHTQGGLAVDDKARVIDQAGRPFVNLFAGGGAACGVSGLAHSGYLSGNGLLSAVTLGRIAGREAAGIAQ
jgi:fumarate reductase flavoprotein subunit